MSRVLVSGGTGFVGRFIVEHLADHGYEVVVGARTPPVTGHFRAPTAFQPLALDATRDQGPAFANIDHFVHAAFEHVPGRYRGGEGNDPEGFRLANLDGSLRLFREARTSGVKTCLFLSSRAVYGEQMPGLELMEETPCRPETLYGRLKLEAEQALAAMSGREFRPVNLRVTGVYGETRPGTRHKWQQLFSDYLAGRPVFPRAGTEVHGDDVGAAVRLAIESPREPAGCATLNVSDVLVENRALLAIVKEITGSTHALPDTAPVACFNAMDTRRLRGMGWQPGGIERLRRTIEALLA
ncbi:NAD(P)-dependent oxidoreductase [Ensifer adhaerens]|uniref:NAD-dependent epimerase/dehydratase family protein n=1 Tax=Ensifer adhaerens TaxID=106592 RepID=UPI001CBD4B7C|nr:NAD(P)-dependent oxidoreductase [Ensifer adhaerens]MBZ7923182.1 NAD(P)-dependent oxidoreductase [Ensifer adhaerens]UAX91767.1 NAD(P)-dependent oxidoreductase [Ensifer adhaerens]UAX99395.1 NAD(P)-dependent oxidoreductase [Ensifer adhaerens]UAY06778.1 NAD(P)-dependent oxidoreductase [Ensifer adhaerens]